MNVSFEGASNVPVLKPGQRLARRLKSREMARLATSLCPIEAVPD